MEKLLILFLTFVSVHSVQLPSYIKPCKITDEACIVKNGNEAWEKIVLGDENFQIPKLSPIFKVGELRIDSNPKFQLIHTDINVKSLKFFKIISAKYNEEQHKLSLTLINTDESKIETKYDLKLIDFVGRDINGRGDLEMNIVNSTYVVDFYLKTTIKESTEFYALEKTEFDFFPEKMTFKFTNLFDGDVIKNKNGNQHINLHWREFLKEVKTVYNGVLKKLIETIFNAYISKVPKNEFFLQ